MDGLVHSVYDSAPELRGVESSLRLFDEDQVVRADALALRVQLHGDLLLQREDAPRPDSRLHEAPEPDELHGSFVFGAVTVEHLCVRLAKELLATGFQWH